MVIKILKLIIVIVCLTNISKADKPIAVDTRIKTYYYSQNEVYPLVIHQGYQTIIEFGDDEDIEDISLGDSYSWSINSSDNRLILKPLEINVHTNMTVITSLRTYHFDVYSKDTKKGFESELVYVLRFYYPDSEGE